MSAIGPVNVADPGSVGIWSAAGALVEALGAIDVVTTRASTLGVDDPPAHVHLGNSSRRVLPALARRRGDVVSLHDVVPRHRGLRPWLGRMQARILRRHHVIVHTAHAADLLARVGGPAPVGLICHLAPVTDIDAATVDRLRRDWQCEHFALTLVSAGVHRAHKGSQELVDAAALRPEIQVVLVGAASPEVEASLDRGLPNVRHHPAPTDADFSHAIAAGDALVAIRRDSVGESSGPVIQAHRLRKPVVGLAAGSLPDLCGPGDVLVAGGGAGAILDATRLVGVADLPADAPQIPGAEDIARRVLSVYETVGLVGRSAVPA